MALKFPPSHGSFLRLEFSFPTHLLQYPSGLLLFFSFQPKYSLPCTPDQTLSILRVTGHLRLSSAPRACNEIFWLSSLTDHRSYTLNLEKHLPCSVRHSHSLHMHSTFWTSLHVTGLNQVKWQAHWTKLVSWYDLSVMFTWEGDRNWGGGVGFITASWWNNAIEPQGLFLWCPNGTSFPSYG